MDEQDDIEFELDFDKAVAVLLFLARADGVEKFDESKACKLLFLADKRHLVKYGRTITGDSYSALPWGPIPSNILDALTRLIEKKSGRLENALDVDRTFRYPRLIAKRAFDETVLSKSDIEILQEIAKEFGSKSFNELKAITHEAAAYKNAWREESLIKSFPMRLLDFFEEDEDAIAGVREEVIENYALKKSFA